jgi:hypothetical protein
MPVAYSLLMGPASPFYAAKAKTWSKDEHKMIKRQSFVQYGLGEEK